jgi:hypothetical protein
MADELPQTGANDEDRLLRYAGYLGIVIAIGLVIAVTALSVGTSLLPRGPLLATVVFTLIMIVVGIYAQRVGRRGGVY